MWLKSYPVIVCLVFASFLSAAQDNELEPVDDTADAIGAILGNKDQAIAGVKVIADTEQSLSIEIRVKGYDDKHKIVGAVLNKLKKPLSEVVSESKVLPKGEGTVELKFQFKQGSGAYKNSFLESHFLSLTIAESGGLLSDLTIGGENVFGDTRVYKLNKKWRVSGSEAMVIAVKLTPFKSATSIKP